MVEHFFKSHERGEDSYIGLAVFLFVFFLFGKKAQNIDAHRFNALFESN